MGVVMFLPQAKLMCLPLPCKCPKEAECPLWERHNTRGFFICPLLTSILPIPLESQTVCLFSDLSWDWGPTSGRTTVCQAHQSLLTPQASALKFGLNKFQQVLQLILQALPISVVLNDPVKVPKVVQTTF